MQISERDRAPSQRLVGEARTPVVGGVDVELSYRRAKCCFTATVDVGDTWVHNLAFRPNGTELAVTVDDSKGNFDLATGEQVGLRFVDPTTGRDVGKPIVFDSGDPIAVAWSPDGRYLAVVTPGAATLWNLEPDAWLRAACGVEGRELTDAEWREQLPAQAPFALCG